MTDLPPALRSAEFPPALLRVLATLRDAGHRSWLVGGAVRDLLIDRARGDADLDVATPAAPQEVTRLFPRAIPTGIEHGTVTIVLGRTKLEVTTFRGEGAYVDGRRPSSVTFHSDLEQDLARRDFTMNAIAFDPLAGELRDPFGGQGDLAARVVRAVGDPLARFGEDGLRPLRAVRFAAQLGFALDPATEAAIPATLAVTAKVAAERVQDELSKLLVAPHAPLGVALLDSTGLLDVVLPAAARSPSRAHAVAVARAVQGHLATRLAALLHALPPAEARAALARLRFPGHVADDAAALVRTSGCLALAARPPPATPADARRWLAAATPRLAPFALGLREADARSLPGRDDLVREAAETRAIVERVAAEHPPLTAGELALDGRAAMQILQIPPGPIVGQALRHLLELVLEEPRRNARPELEAALREWWSHRPPGVR